MHNAFEGFSRSNLIISDIRGPCFFRFLLIRLQLIPHQLLTARIATPYHLSVSFFSLSLYHR
jgi:hypothetical protein